LGCFFNAFRFVFFVVFIAVIFGNKDRKRLTRYDIVMMIITILCFVLIIGYAVYFSEARNSTPESNPGLYSFAGNIPRTGGGDPTVMPIIAVIILVGITLLERFPLMWGLDVYVKKENEVFLFRVQRNLLVTLKVFLVTLLVLISFNSTLTNPMPGWLWAVYIVFFSALIAWRVVKLIKTIRRG